MTVFRLGPPNGGIESRGMKNRDFRQIAYLALSRKRYKAEPQLQWKAKRKAVTNV